jgi:hypothetical protein
MNPAAPVTMIRFDKNSAPMKSQWIIYRRNVTAYTAPNGDARSSSAVHRQDLGS